MASAESELFSNHNLLKKLWFSNNCWYLIKTIFDCPDFQNMILKRVWIFFRPSFLRLAFFIKVFLSGIIRVKFYERENILCHGNHMISMEITSSIKYISRKNQMKTWIQYSDQKWIWHPLNKPWGLYMKNRGFL